MILFEQNRGVFLCNASFVTWYYNIVVEPGICASLLYSELEMLRELNKEDARKTDKVMSTCSLFWLAQ